MTGYVNLDFSADQIFVWGHSRTVEGVLVVNGYHDALSADVPAEDLGGAIVRGLERTDVDVPGALKGDVQRTLRRLVKLSGRDSFKKYAQDVISVGVDRDDDGSITLMPTRANRKRSSFDFVPELFIVLPPPVVDMDLGKLALVAKSRCV